LVDRRLATGPSARHRGRHIRHNRSNPRSQASPSLRIALPRTAARAAAWRGVCFPDRSPDNLLENKIQTHSMN
jgi:hypothetical protein